MSVHQHSHINLLLLLMIQKGALEDVFVLEQLICKLILTVFPVGLCIFVLLHLDTTGDVFV